MGLYSCGLSRIKIRNEILKYFNKYSTKYAILKIIHICNLIYLWLVTNNIYPLLGKIITLYKIIPFHPAQPSMPYHFANLAISADLYTLQIPL